MLDPSAALTLHLLEVVILRTKASYLPFRWGWFAFLNIHLKVNVASHPLHWDQKLIRVFYPTFNHVLLIAIAPILLHEEKQQFNPKFLITIRTLKIKTNLWQGISCEQDIVSQPFSMEKQESLVVFNLKQSYITWAR